LKKALKEGLADSLDIENVDGDERVVEMDVALLKVRFFFLLVLGFGFNSRAQFFSTSLQN